MTDMTRLERGYRRLLACYPRAFRDENEDEIIAVLVATAKDAQSSVAFAEAADLIRGALRARMWPGMHRPPRPVFAAIRLMCVGAVLELAVCCTLIATSGDIHAAILRRYPALTAAEWHSVAASISVSEIGSPIAAGLWLWLAWANWRGRDWGRFGYIALFLFTTVGVLVNLGQGSAVVAPAAMAVAGGLWLVGAAAMALICSPRSAPHYRRRLAVTR
jgi:hypothetical protein